MDKELRIPEFNPKGKEYYYTACNQDFCYKNKNGICSLDLTEEEVKNINKNVDGEDYIYCQKNSVNYCRDIYKSLIKDGQKKLVYLNQKKCGHYTFTDGQHRLCIAARKGLKLDVQLYVDIKYPCRICIEENNITKNIKDVEEMVSKTTPKRTLIHKILKKYPQSIFQDLLYKWNGDLEEFQNRKKREYKKF